MPTTWSATLRRLWLASWPLAGLAILVALAYSNAVAPSYVWDDHALIEANPAVRGNGSLLAPFTAPFFPENALAFGRGYYRPLTILSFAAEYRLRGNDPAGFHSTNVALHLLNALLVLLVCRRTGASRGASFLAAALWGLAPRLTESVTWVSGRTDLLAGLGTLAALAAFISASPFVRALSPLFFGAGLLGKEVAVAVVPAVFLLEWARREDGRWRRALRATAPFLAVLALWLVARSAALSGRPVLTHVSGGARALTVLEAAGWYPLMALDAFRPRAQIGLVGVPNGPVLWIGALALVAALLAVPRLLKSRPPVLAGLGLVGGGLLPVLHLVPVVNNVVAADRFLYLPLAGLAVAGAAAADRLPPSVRRWLAVSAGVLAIASVPRIRARNLDWSDDLRLWTTTVREAPERNDFARHQLAKALLESGRRVEMVRTWGTFASLGSDAAGGLVPDVRPFLHDETAAALSSFGRYDAAGRVFGGMARGSPGAGLAFATSLRAQSGDLEGAWRLGEASPALLSDESVTTIRTRLGRVLAAEHSGPAGRPRFRLALAAGTFGGLPADRAFLSLAEDPRVSPMIRVAAARWLLRASPTPAGRRALAALASCRMSAGERRELGEEFHRRERRDAEVHDLLAGLEAGIAGRLGTPPFGGQLSGPAGPPEP